MVPAYQPDESYLRQMLASVLAQDPGAEAMQIEVVDDASPDADVASMVRQIAGDRVRVRRSPKNLGLAGCWNECVRLAEGERVHLLHQDDIVLPGFYRALDRGFESGRDVGAAFCRHAVIDPDGHWGSLSPLERSDPGVLENWLPKIATWSRIQCPAIVVRKSVYDRLGGFRVDLGHVLDWEMWMRIARSHPIFYDPAILACFRRHSESATTANEKNGRALAEGFHALKLFSSHRGREESAEAYRIYSEYGLKLVRRLAKEGDTAAAWANLRTLLCRCRRRKVWSQGVRMIPRLIARSISRSNQR